jgi:hypothetical protein
VALDKKAINGLHLKLIAIITMTIDHIGAVIVNELIGLYPDLYHRYIIIYNICRDIGRLAFPIFCFLIVEGFFHTHNVKKYMARLLVFAMISEIPFDLAFYGQAIYPDYQNVFFTLFFGLLSIYFADLIMKKDPGSMKMKLLSLLPIFACAGLSFLLKTDYGAEGVLTVVLIYFFYGRSKSISIGLSAVFLGLCLDISEFFALVDMIPVYFYNGKRGKQKKYFFYIYYPLHLLALRIVCIAIKRA